MVSDGANSEFKVKIQYCGFKIGTHLVFAAFLSGLNMVTK